MGPAPIAPHIAKHVHCYPPGDDSMYVHDRLKFYTDLRDTWCYQNTSEMDSVDVELWYQWQIYINLKKKCNAVFISCRRRRPGEGRYCNAPPVRPSVRPSVCPSVTFSFRTVTQKRIAVFSQNFAGTCTKSWGVLYSFWYWWNVVWIFVYSNFFFNVIAWNTKENMKFGKNKFLKFYFFQYFKKFVLKNIFF